MSGLAEIIVPVPHLVAVDRLPEQVSAGGLVVERTGAASVVGVVGSLRGHVAVARWRAGRRTGDAAYEVVRTHEDRCALTVVLDGLDGRAAWAVAEEVRRRLTLEPATVRAATTGTVALVAAPPVTRPA